MFSRRWEWKSCLNIRFEVCGSILEENDETEIFITKSHSLTLVWRNMVNLKMFYHHFSLQLLHISQCFRKEFGQFYINIPILNLLDEERPNTVRLKVYYKKPSIFHCNFSTFHNYFRKEFGQFYIIYKRILSTFHDVFEQMGVKIIHKHLFCDLRVNIGGIGWNWSFITKSRFIAKVVLTVLWPMTSWNLI